MFDKQMEHSVRVGVLGGSRRRLDGIGRGCLFLDASHFQYHAGAAARWCWPPGHRHRRQGRVRRPGRRSGGVRGRLGRVLAGLGERGLACRCWSSPAGGRADRRRRDRRARRAAPVRSLAMAIETAPATSSAMPPASRCASWAGAPNSPAPSSSAPASSSPRSSPLVPPACSPCTVPAPTPPPCSWSPPGITRSGCAPRRPGRTCARSSRSRHRRGKALVTASIPAATARPTTPYGRSCSHR
jgi:hypothetical protein